MFRWNFPEYHGFEDKGLNAFEIDSKESPIQTFTREICQNSNDAKCTNPVRIDFELFSIDVSDLPDAGTLRHVMGCCLEKAKNYKYNKTPYEVYEHRLNLIDSGKVRVLRVSDYNTSGLTGSNTSDSTSKWATVTSGAGVSDKAKGSAGSHGRGKDSFYAMSDLSTVFISTLDEDGVTASIGISKQMTYTDQGVVHEGFGCFVDEENVYSTEQLFLEPGFVRSRPGTDIYIPALKESEDEIFQMKYAVIRDFFVNILEGKMVVSINREVIDKNTILDVLVSLNGRNDSENSDLLYLRELIDCYLGGPAFSDKKYDVYLAQSEQFFYVTSVRSGMTIDRKFHKLPQEHIVGLVVVSDEETSDLLLSSEDISHNKWNPDNATASRKSQILALIKLMKESIRAEVNKMLDKQRGISRDAVGLNRYLPVVNPQVQDQKLSRKEFLYDPVRKVKMHKRSPPKPKVDDEVVPTDSQEMEAVDVVNPDENTTPIHGDNPDSKPYVNPDDDVTVVPGPNPDYVRKFKTVALKDVRSICSDIDSKEYKVYYRCNKESEFYLTVFIGTETGGATVNVVSAVGENGSEYKVENNRIGPIAPNGGIRTYLRLSIDYPIACSITVGGECDE